LSPGHFPQLADTVIAETTTAHTAHTNTLRIPTSLPVTRFADLKRICYPDSPADVKPPQQVIAQKL
jgi:hypothetical protein